MKYGVKILQKILNTYHLPKKKRLLAHCFDSSKTIISFLFRFKRDVLDRGGYPALDHILPWAVSFFFKGEENKYFLPYAYCFIFKSDLLNPNFFEKNSYFILFFLESYFFDEQSKFLDIRFYWNKKFKHRFIY